MNPGSCPVDHEALVEQAKAFHIFSPDIPDMHEFYGQLRDHCPVARSELFGGYWILTRHEDVHRVLKDGDHFSAAQMTIPYTENVHGKQIPLQSDPPEHTHYRHVFNRFFSPQAVAQIEDEARILLRGMLEKVVAAGETDFVRDVCIPYPGTVFALILGTPVEDAQQLVDWTHSIIHDGYSGDPAKMEHVMTVVQPAVSEYFSRLLDQRRDMEDAPDDLLTGISQGMFDDRPLSRTEHLALLQFFLQGGLETVTSLLSMIAWDLALHPDRRQQLIDDPSIIPTTIEEFLRYYSGISSVRVCTNDVEFHGVTIKAGEPVLVPTPSAGRDGLEFPDPDTVDLRRSPNRHLGFGGGAHRCVGASLARMELKVALEEMLRIMPNFELAPGYEAQWRWGISLGFDELKFVIR